MITRPLDLAARLRRAPRSFDWVFLVNGGLIVLMFVLFGSRFVLSPGLGVEFQLPDAAGGARDAHVTTHVITVRSAGQILVADGFRTMEQMPEWLASQAAHAERQPALLVRAGADVPAGILTRILALAHAAGFAVTVAAEDKAQRPSAAPQP